MKPYDLTIQFLDKRQKRTHRFPKDMYENVHSSTIHNSPKLKATPKSINNRMDKSITVYSVRTNQLLLHVPIWVNLINAMLGERNQTKGIHTVCLHLYKVQK